MRRRLRRVLPPEFSAAPAASNNVDSSEVQCLDPAAPLAKYLPFVLSALHLVYEESKLSAQVSSCSSLGLLAALLHLLRGAAHLGGVPLLGGTHYSHDFARECSAAEKEFGSARMSPFGVLLLYVVCFVFYVMLCFDRWCFCQFRANTTARLALLVGKVTARGYGPRYCRCTTAISLPASCQ